MRKIWIALISGLLMLLGAASPVGAAQSYTGTGTATLDTSHATFLWSSCRMSGTSQVCSYTSQGNVFAGAISGTATENITRTIGADGSVKFHGSGECNDCKTLATGERTGGIGFNISGSGPVASAAGSISGSGTGQVSGFRFQGNWQGGLLMTITLQYRYAP